jgi:hypothetical protein
LPTYILTTYTDANKFRWLSDFYFNNLWFQFLKFSEIKGPLVVAYLKISRIKEPLVLFFKKPPRTSGFHEITGKEFAVL